jgi:hypothetical protein
MDAVTLQPNLKNADLNRFVTQVEESVKEEPYIADDNLSFQRAKDWGVHLFTFPIFADIMSSVAEKEPQEAENLASLYGLWMETYFRAFHSAENFVPLAIEFFSKEFWVQWEVTIIAGVTFPEPFELSDGLYLTPLDHVPLQPEKQKFVFGNQGYIPYQCAAFVRSEKVYNSYYDIINGESLRWKNQFDQRYYDNIRLQAETVRLCLGLMSGGTCHISGSYRTADPAIFPPPQLGCSSSRNWYPGLDGTTIDLDDLRRLFTSALKMGGREAWIVGVDRLLRSRSGLNEVDPLIDLGMSCEILLMHSTGNSQSDGKGEISHKLKTRAAWLIGHDVEERKQVAQIVNTAYAARSIAVHTGTTPSPKKCRLTGL